jgi:S-adenosylmethionine:tRNA ribosyltransferase-isomerase
MRLADFDYDLPRDLIAQTPAAQRDASRLLVVERASGTFAHRRFSDIEEYLRAGDVLAVNDTRVLPARLRGRRATGGAVEVFLLRPDAAGGWEALVRPARRLRAGEIVTTASGDRIEIGARLPSGTRRVLGADADLTDLMHRAGEVPLPPYIRRAPADPERYQTVYARADGAVAAPTAGLHFTPTLLDRLRGRGVRVVTITLHVGPGTFKPVTVDDITTHRMEREFYAVAREAADAINARTGRLIAVGTTTVRTLETAAGGDRRVQPGSGETALFLYPGAVFRVTDGLVTNFHLPRSTLLMLVSAFAGRDLIMRAYAEAIRERYRFYSFGDAMLIL